MLDPVYFSKFGETLRVLMRAPDCVREDHCLAEDGAFNALAMELFGLQFATVEALGRLGAHRGLTPKSVRHWREIPAVPTSAFKELEVTSLAPAVRTAVFHSSGTTGHRPSRHFHDAESLEVYEASLGLWFRAHVLAGAAVDVGRWRIITLTPPAVEVPHSSLAHMAHVVIREFGCPESGCMGRVDASGAWHVDGARVAERLAAAVGSESVVMFGTAFSFVHLLEQWGAEGIRVALPPGSRVMETGGYKGRSRVWSKRELHEGLAGALGVGRASIVCEYGMSELSSQAYDGVAGWERGEGEAEAGSFRFPPWARALVVSPETGQEVGIGETGWLRIVDLANLRSVLAVQTEDLAVRTEDGFQLLGRGMRSEPRGCSLMMK